MSDVVTRDTNIGKYRKAKDVQKEEVKKYWRLYLEIVIPGLLAFLSGIWAYYLIEMKLNKGEVLLRESSSIILISEISLTGLIAIVSLVFVLYKVVKKLRRV